MSRMDTISQHPWQALLLTPLSAEQVGQALPDDDPQWEYLDGQMVKLGSLAHATLDLNEIQQQLVTLLAEKSKDFRLMVHLLRTLQHGGNAQSLLLAVSLLTNYVQNFWSVSWPQNPVHKRRFAEQIIKRFDSASPSFTQQASAEQRDTMQGLLAHLAQLWHHSEPDLAKHVDSLRSHYARVPEREIVSSTDAVVQPTPPSAAPVAMPAAVRANAPVAEFVIDNASEKVWRQTLLKMADILCESQPDNSIGFRLRRHAVWGSLTTLPAAQSEGRTPLAAVSPDRTADYLARIATADLALWWQVEQSLTLAPFWLDGHALSARIASRLGFDAVTETIRDELTAFLERLPGLRTLFFNDMTPFLSAETAAWLQVEVGEQKGTTVPQQDEIWQCYQQQGLEAALHLLDRQTPADPRARFYQQLLSAQLLEEAGLTSLASQHYVTLFAAGEQRQLSEWEPAVMALLSEKQRQQKP